MSRRLSCSFCAAVWLGALWMGPWLPALPSAQAAAQPPASHARPISPPQARIDINHAPLEELLKIPGLTRSWAGRIVRYRPYRTKQDLLDRGVVPSEVYGRIKDFVIAHRDKQ